MKQLFLLIILCSTTFGNLQAQTSTFNLIERQNKELSPSEKRFNTHSKNMDVRQLYQLYSNPAYHEWMHTQDSLLKRKKYRSSVYTGYANGDLKGDYLIFEGNAFEDYRVGATGEYSIKSNGVIFGSVQYSRGKHKNISWTGARHSDLYTPYISTDSLGGDFEYEDYNIEGGYAFTLKNWKLGVKGSFHGEQAHRKTDPRALNKTTWLNFGIGASRVFNGHLLMLEGDFGKNKQHMDLQYWRPGQQDCFFVCYGFGLHDIRQSKVSFGYERMYYITEANTRLTYQSPTDRPLSVYASLGYEYDHMKTEETNICDLYYSKTHSLLPTIRLDWKVSSPWLISLWLDGRMDFRKGFENIFERYQSDVENNIYDYRLIDTQQNYNEDKMFLMGQLRATYQLNPKHRITLIGGASSSYRKETHSTEGYKIENSSIFPHGSIAYLMRVKNSELEISCLYGKKVNLDNTYDVNILNQSVQHLDFQHAFAPYAYYNSTYSSFQVNASYTYHFKKCALGINAKLMYTDGERDEEAYFDGKIGYQSTAPLISVTPDKHDEIWGSSSIFLVF